MASASDDSCFTSGFCGFSLDDKTLLEAELPSELTDDPLIKRSPWFDVAVFLFGLWPSMALLPLRKCHVSTNLRGRVCMVST